MLTISLSVFFELLRTELTVIKRPQCHIIKQFWYFDVSVSDQSKQIFGGKEPSRSYSNWNVELAMLGFFWDQDFETISVSNTAQCRMTGRTVWLAFAWLMLVTSPLSKLSPTYSWIDADGFQQHRVDWLLECCFANQCFPKLWGACSFTIILQCDLQ